MSSKEIREAFFNFFKSKGHQLVQSAPIVVKDDPTLMFTNAGMNQFKDVFLGNESAKHKRLVDTQKCLRVSGKHNDLEEVGVDTYHHTMFEMLGNWSFGDFFKAEMIPWAWEFLTDEIGLDKDRLYATVFGGDKEDGLELDEEAYQAWKEILPEERILKAGKKDNFWEMGDVGPCGPCSEIHIDLRSESERAKINGATLVNQDHPQVVEIWNLVFMEYNRMKDQSLNPLPNKHVDTGMGFERLCMAIQNKQSNYDTDVFLPLIEKVENLTKLKYQELEGKQAIAFRVIVDHIRAIAFSIADGQLPSNTGAGYVIRRILRRAVRYGYSFLELKEPFLNQLVEALISSMGSTFNELSDQRQLIEKVILEEEQAFLRTLEKGIERFENYVKGGAKQIDGKFAFELYDTFGFPIDLTQLLAEEESLKVDLAAFEANLEEQKNRSREASKIDAGDWHIVKEGQSTEFIGYDNTEAEVELLRYRSVDQKGKKFFQLVFNQTPFYPEGGGQVGDNGFIQTSEEKVSILDTQKENNLIIHFSKELPQNLSAQFRAIVDTKSRKKTRANHSATHLLHLALREILGTHVEQKGSLVSPDYLRFDFSHFQKVSAEEIRQIELFVNSRVRENIQLEEAREMPIEEAKAKGAMALFGEKYGDKVRVIQFGESVELCGGTHVKATGEIGFFKITSESAVASGIRRIEAVSGAGAEKLILEQNDLIEEIKNQLKQSKNISQAVANLQNDNQKLQKEIEKLKAKAAGNVKDDLIKSMVEVNGVNSLIKEVELDAGSIKNIAFQLKGEVDNLFLVLASKAGGKPTITVLISDNLVQEKDWNAGQIVRDLAKNIQGGGGGQAFFATAGGKNPEGIQKALEDAKGIIA